MRLVALFALFLVVVRPLPAEVRLVGSDLLGKAFAAALADYSRRDEAGLTLDFQGSRAGLEKLEAGNADVGILLFAPDEPKPSAPYVVLPVAYQTAVVVVPSSLPLTQITFAQLASIYADEGQATLRRWADLGVVGDWAARSILPNITGPGAGLSYDLFRHTVLPSPQLKPTVTVHDSVPAMLRRIMGEEGGIAIMPVLPANQPRLKTLLVAKSAQDVAFGPTPDNIHSGDYPIRLTVYLVFRKDAVRKLQPVLRHLLSEEALPLWEKAQLTPLPVQARNQQMFDLEVL